MTDVGTRIALLTERERAELGEIARRNPLKGRGFLASDEVQRREDVHWLLTKVAVLAAEIERLGSST